MTGTNEVCDVSSSGLAPEAGDGCFTPAGPRRAGGGPALCQAGGAVGARNAATADGRAASEAAASVARTAVACAMAGDAAEATGDSSAAGGAFAMGSAGRFVELPTGVACIAWACVTEAGGDAARYAVRTPATKSATVPSPAQAPMRLALPSDIGSGGLRKGPRGPSTRSRPSESMVAMEPSGSRG